MHDATLVPRQQGNAMLHPVADQLSVDVHPGEHSYLHGDSSLVHDGALLTTTYASFVFVGLFCCIFDHEAALREAPHTRRTHGASSPPRNHPPTACLPCGGTGFWRPSACKSYMLVPSQAATSLRSRVDTCSSLRSVPHLARSSRTAARTSIALIHYAR